MNEQPEALRLADELAIQDQCDFYKVCEEAALELRWLHEENERLRRDADRYRWLRDMIYDDRIIVAADRMLHGEALDVAVDAALQEQPR